MECIHEAQRNDLLLLLKKESQNSTQFSYSEKQFMNNIRSIANDLEDLYAAVDTTLPAQSYYNQIKYNFLSHADEVKQLANTFYNGDSAKIILAQNAFVLMSYDALQRKYPEFMWTQLGVFAANEVRAGLVMALELRHDFINKHTHIIIDNNGTEMTDMMYAVSEILINGQINVLTDIGSFGIANHQYGTSKIKNENWLTAEAKEGFRLQELSQNALKNNDCLQYMDLQTEAAIQFGAHEQIYILQPMWDQPNMKLFADLNKMVLQLTNKKITVLGDIFIGTDKNLEIQNGYTIKIPSTVNDLSNAQQRVAVAMNGFHQLNNLRKDANWNYWMDYSQIKIGYAYNTYQAKGL
ncbi:MAG TPA: hypothetical protein PK431_00815 [Chitinophagales bacterium]|nr:hypothetical protein [Chitinophagales bacterium]